MLVDYEPNDSEIYESSFARNIDTAGIENVDFSKSPLSPGSVDGTDHHLAISGDVSADDHVSSTHLSNQMTSEGSCDDLQCGNATMDVDEIESQPEKPPSTNTNNKEGNNDPLSWITDRVNSEVSTCKNEKSSTNEVTKPQSNGLEGSSKVSKKATSTTSSENSNASAQTYASAASSGVENMDVDSRVSANTRNQKRLVATFLFVFL